MNFCLRSTKSSAFLLSKRWLRRNLGRLPKQIILDMDTSVNPTYSNQEDSTYNHYFEYTFYHPLFCFNQHGRVERTLLCNGNVRSSDDWQRNVLKVRPRLRYY